MTRDEAIELAHEKWVKPNTTCSASIVDILSALGILKLDEPRISDFESELPHGYIGKVRSFMRKFGLGGASPIELERALDAAGLRIVEK